MQRMQPPIFSSNDKAQIDYPCSWLYKVIGKDPEALQHAIRTACAPAPVRITPSHSSSQGTYWSLNAELEVASEAMRLAIYRSLTDHPAVKFVL